MATQNPTATPNEPSATVDSSEAEFFRFNACTSDLNCVVLAYLDGTNALLGPYLRGCPAAKGAAMMLREAAAKIDAATNLLDLARGDRKAVTQALTLIEEAGELLEASAATISASQEYGVAEDAPAFLGSAPIMSAAVLAERGAGVLEAIRRRVVREARGMAVAVAEAA